MRPPTITVDSSENPVVKTTTFREVVPAASAAKVGKLPTPDYWEFVRAIDAKTVGDYMLYLYRDEPGRLQIDHTSGAHWEPPGYPMIPIADQEELEATIARDCGGGVFQLICKRRSNSEWMTSTKFRIEMGSRPITPWFMRRTVAQGNGNGGTGATRTVIPGDPNVQIASEAMRVVAGQEHAAVNIGLELFKAAGDVLRNPMQNGYQDQIMRSLLERALNPPAPPVQQDPIELLTRVMSLQERINPTGSSGGNPIVNRILETAVSRMLEPVNVSPAVSAGAEIVRSLPGIAGQFVEGIREWRLGKEAERDSVIAMQHPPQPQRPPQPGVPQPQVFQQPQVLPAPRPQPSVNPAIGGVVPPSIEFVESRIVEIFRAPIGAQEAAERALEFLYTLDGDHATPETSYVQNLTRMGETGLMQLFQTRPILKGATANSQRLLDFIHAFLRLYQEDKKADEQDAAAKPN